MNTNRVAIWKKAPFIRFLSPFTAGIMIQWYLQVDVRLAWFAIALAMVLFVSSFFLSHFRRFQFSILHGIAVTIIFLSMGSLLAWYKDIRHDPRWMGNYYDSRRQTLIAVLQEPLVEKANSYKAVGTVKALFQDNRYYSVCGNVIIYFEKDVAVGQLDFGALIVFSKPIQAIPGATNPGGFDYKRYCLFQGITHQVFLKKKEFVLLKEKQPTMLAKILFPIRRKVLFILRKYVHGAKEQGLAEALLIGYKDDLDKNLVQSYTNTGVVHVIAISGLHLGLIYWLLVRLFAPLRKKKISNWFSPIMIIGGLWLFSFIAGAQPSVLRSALMFTCIILADGFSRKTSIYNSLAFSAFVLLCVNPFWLWDVGFQLSYSAVLSIVIFMKPIYNWFYVKNKILDSVWKLNAISVAAQLLTTPFSIYHFHQFPTYFLLSNLIAVPLSSIIVLGEIFLCAVSVVPSIALVSGRILSWLISLMNSYIERIDSLPCSLWEGLLINSVQAAMIIAIIVAVASWWLVKEKFWIWPAMIFLLIFDILRSGSFYQSNQQQIFIVYNIPKHQAIDLINGRNYFFIGDSELLANEFARNFHLKPSHTLYRVTSHDSLPNFFRAKNFIEFGSKRILLGDHDFAVDSCSQRAIVDVLVLSRNSNVHLLKLSKVVEIRQVVFDGSGSPGRIKHWIKDCDSLRIHYHNVNEKGAFVMRLN
jgi:competence protein ComEC